MNSKYYTVVKMSQIILDLINLHQEMEKDGYTDRQSLQELVHAINTLQYYLQFLKPITGGIRYYKGH